MPVTKRAWVSFSKAKAILVQMIQDGSHEGPILDLSASLVKKLPPLDQAAQAQSLWSYVKRNVLYLEDPYGDDHFQGPQVTLQRGAGDCDDQTILLGALMRSIGMEIRLVFVFEKPPTGSAVEYASHVYLEANVGRMIGEDLWVSADTIPHPEANGGFYYATFAKESPLGYRERVDVL